MTQKPLVGPQSLASSAIAPTAITFNTSKKRKAWGKETLKTQDGKARGKRLKESNAALQGPIGKDSDTNAQNPSEPASNVSDPWPGRKAYTSQDGKILASTLSWAAGLPSTNCLDELGSHDFRQLQLQQRLLNGQESTNMQGVKPSIVELFGDTSQTSTLQDDAEHTLQSNQHCKFDLTTCSFLPEKNKLVEKPKMHYPTGSRAVLPCLAQGVGNTGQSLCGAQNPYIAHIKSKHIECIKTTPTINTLGNVTLHGKGPFKKVSNLSLTIPSISKEVADTPVLHSKTQGGISANSNVIPAPQMVLSPVQLKPAPSGVGGLQNATAVQPECEDMDISWKSIAYPPRFIFRKKIHSLSRILALVAFHCSTAVEPAGDFLKCTITLSKIYYYATVLAYGLLCTDYELPGKRTTLWVKMKRVDLTIADLRGWYWHRIRQRLRKIQEVRQRWWGERVWTEYIHANHLQQKFQKLYTEQGLWFQGINTTLLSENEVSGQWDVAARFWAARFCASMFSGKIEKAQDIDEMLGGGAYAVADARPVGENGGDTQVSAGSVVSEVWEIVDKGGNIYFVVGGTGEAIGTLHRSTRLFRKCERIVRSPGPREGTAITANVIPTLQLTNQDHQPDNNIRPLLESLDDITWKSLRMDWRNYVLRLLTVINISVEKKLSSPLGLATEPAVPLLLSHLYHPSPAQFKHAIHQHITLPRHRVVCERFVLAHAEDYGYSGGRANPISGGRKVGLDLDCKWRVESVVCSGETLKCCGRAGKLAHGLAFIQTVEGGWYILEDTGEVCSYLSLFFFFFFVSTELENEKKKKLLPCTNKKHGIKIEPIDYCARGLWDPGRMEDSAWR